MRFLNTADASEQQSTRTQQQTDHECRAGDGEGLLIDVGGGEEREEVEEVGVAVLLQHAH